MNKNIFKRKTALGSIFLLALGFFFTYRPSIRHYPNETFAFKESYKFGLMDKKGKVFLKPQFSFIDSFQEGFAGILDEESNFKVIDKWGRIIPSVDKNMDWSTFRGFHEGVAAVRFGNHLFGYINTKGELAIPPAYKEADEFNEGLARVRVKGKYGFINKMGETVLPFSLEVTHATFNDNRLGVKVGDKWGFSDARGKIAVQPSYEYVHPFQEGFAYVRDNKFFGFIDKNGNYIYKKRFPECPKGTKRIAPVDITKFDPFAFAISSEVGSSFVGKRAVVKENGKYGYIDTTGKLLIPCIYEQVNDFSEGVAAVKENGIWGFIDLEGKYIIPPKYEQVENFSEGYAFVRIGPTWTFVDKNGKEIVPTQFLSGGSFHSGLAQVIDGYIDTNGKMIKYDSESASEYLRGKRIDLRNKVFNSKISLFKAYNELDTALTLYQNRLLDKSRFVEKMSPNEWIQTLKELADYSQFETNPKVLSTIITELYKTGADGMYEKNARNLALYYGDILSAWLKLEHKDTEGAVKTLRETRKAHSSIFLMGAYWGALELRLFTALIQVGKTEDVIHFINEQTENYSELEKRNAQKWIANIQRKEIPAEWMPYKKSARTDCR